MDKVLTNLPQSESIDSANRTKTYLNNFGNNGEEYLSAEVDATIGFLTNKGFGIEAASVTAIVLLQQAKRDGFPVFKLLETLQSLNQLELSGLVAEILNLNRSQTSRLGFRTAISANQIKLRNIRA